MHRPTRGRDLAIALLSWGALFGGSIATVLILVRVVRLAVLREHLADVSAFLLLDGYVALLLGLMIGFGGVRGLRDRLGFRFTSLRDLALAPALWFACLVTGGLIAIPLSRIFGEPTSNAVAILKRVHDPLFLVIVVSTAALLAPAAEEMLFRGAIFGWLRSRLPVAVAGGLSAAIFAGAHLAPLLFPYLFLFGLAAAFLYHKTGSTLNSFVMHACQNTLALISAYTLISRSAG